MLITRSFRALKYNTMINKVKMMTYNTNSVLKKSLMFIMITLGLISASRVIDLKIRSKLLKDNDTTLVNLTCQSKVAKVDGVHIVCFTPGCKIDTHAVRFNDTCYKLSKEITSFQFAGRILSFITPNEEENKCHELLSHSWCTVLINLRSLVIASALWILGFFIRIPMMHMLRIVDKLSTYIIVGKKKCASCNKQYRLAHFECDVATHDRTDYHILYYIFIITLMITIPTVSASDDSKFNTYSHDDYTEFLINDKENVMNEFYKNQNHIKITVLRSYYDYRLSYMHDVLEKQADVIESTSYSCKDDVNACYKQLKGDKNTFGSVKKSHDGFTCVFDTALLCASCKVKTEKYAEVYETTSINPVIEIKVEINNDIQKLILIDNFEDFVDETFYIRSLNVIEPEPQLVMIKDKEAYIGNICGAPSKSCYGAHISKNNETSFYYEPEYIDDNHWSSSIQLRKCTINENLDLKQLRYIGRLLNGTVHENKEFGHYSIGVRTKMLLNDKVCENEVTVRSIMATGCYNCKYGFDLEIEHMQSKIKRCGKIICSTPIYKAKTYVKDGIPAKLKLFSDKKTLKVICNGKTFEVTLNEDKISNHYTSSSYVAEVNVDKVNDLKNAFNLISMDNVKIIVFSLIAIVATYCTMHFILKLSTDFVKLKKAQMLRRKDSGSPEAVILTDTNQTEMREVVVVKRKNYTEVVMNNSDN